MKYIIASDIHGSAHHLGELIKIFKRDEVDMLILLGDVYNHGPRNPFPTEYEPMSVADQLNAIKDKLIVIKGNCDSQVDTMISEFDFIEDMILVINGKKFFLTHGHVYNKSNMPKTAVDGIIYGHFHTGFIEIENGVIVANTGSTSLPKNGTEHSYILIDESTMKLKSLDDKVITEINI